MKRLMEFATTCVAVAALTDHAWAGERPMAEVSCAPSGEKLVYDCVINLMTMPGHRPIEGAEITVKADMPSMPMAHIVAPIKAAPKGGAGKYHARLHLEMLGEWALTMDIAGPVRDRIVKKLHFGGSDAGSDHGKMNMPGHAGANHKH
jgi:hypothetical protein